MLNLDVKTIPKGQHRYPTCGDYWDEGNKNVIRVSDMKNRKFEWLVFMHEEIERFLCEINGIKERDITAFDIQYEKEREWGLHDEEDEPGWDKAAPYHKYHVFAENIERILAQAIGVDWDKYEKTIIKNS